MRKIRQHKKMVAVLILLLTSGLVWTLTAGNLNPPGPPESTMRTLDEIYTAFTSNTAMTSTDFSAVVSKDFAKAASGRDLMALLISEYPGSGFPGQQGLENASKIVDVEQRLVVPYDTASGLPSGARQHGPIRIVKTIDKASPGLHKALCTGQRLMEVKIEFYWIDPVTRQLQVYYRITLSDVHIIEIGPTTNVTEDYSHMERISFVYEEIEWSWLPDNILEMDQWAAPSH